jgi:hypothetical protein
MPTIVDYDTVVARMAEQKMRCQYYNSGAFGFDADAALQFTGWIGPEDSTIRPAALAHAKRVPAPYEENLARLATEVWLELLPGNVWVMPKSSWAYELDFGSKAWLPAALRLAGIDPEKLEGRTNAPAIEFASSEATSFTALVQALLENLLGSDFALGFPGYPAGCTVHHHKQIWWISTDEKLISQIAEMAE